MVQRYELFGPSVERFGNPAPLGLLGLAIASVALVPIAFGVSLTASALGTAAMYALLFGAACQFLSGMMLFANKSSFGGTVFTCFSFNWAMNAWVFHGLSQGKLPDHAVGLAVEVVLLVIFAALTWGFGYFGKALFLFLVDIDLLFVFRIVRSVTHTKAMELPIAFSTVVLALLGLWLAFGALLNPVVGRAVFPVGAPIFHAPKKDSFDWTLRRTIFTVLYAEWKSQAFRPMALAELKRRLGVEGVEEDPVPNLHYLAELGFAVLTTNEAGDIVNVRLHAKGVDIHEQLVLGKYAPTQPAH
ncbi:MAG: GPR1/FUN34/YaaH family transporter [Polyangiaceae bacterium]